MKWIRRLIFLILLVIGAIFVLDNKQPVALEMRFFALSFEAPFFVWIWGAFLLGLVVCYLFLALRYFGSAISSRDLSKENEALRHEIDALKCEARLKEAYQDNEDDEKTG